MEAQVAARYAEALFGVLQEHEIIDQGLADLRRAQEVIEASPDLRTAIQHPELPAAAKRELLGRVLGGEVREVVLAFLSLLAERRRFAALPHVILELERLANEAHNLVPVRVTSAIPLTVEQQARLAAALARRTGQRVRLTTSIDPEVLAGVWLRLDDQVIDGTARWRLEEMRRAVHEIEFREQGDETTT
jgi:F-type H+-transporting ATPase subunit delta